MCVRKYEFYCKIMRLEYFLQVFANYTLQISAALLPACCSLFSVWGCAVAEGTQFHSAVARCDSAKLEWWHFLSLKMCPCWLSREGFVLVRGRICSLPSLPQQPLAGDRLWLHLGKLVVNFCPVTEMLHHPLPRYFFFLLMATTVSQLAQHAPLLCSAQTCEFTWPQRMKCATCKTRKPSRKGTRFPRCLSIVTQTSWALRRAFLE